MKTVLVCGGAGYIGSVMTAYLRRNGIDVVVADSLVTGHREAVGDARLYIGDLRDKDFLRGVFSENEIDGVVDFAAFSQVGESVAEPIKYYENNTQSVLSLLTVMREYGVKNLVFSSTAAVYGEPESQPICETAKTEPTNPYGATKLAVEGILKWCSRAYGMRYMALRYFNASGADTESCVGEDHSPETHLIPLVLKTALGQRGGIGVFGTDYPTRDGTCVRDYIHVEDLARAHLLALEYLERGGESGSINLGSGDGFTVLEIIEKAREITGRQIEAFPAPRREGDPSTLIASNEKAYEVLGWRPEKTLSDMIGDAWQWHLTHPEGYKTL